MGILAMINKHYQSLVGRYGLNIMPVEYMKFALLKHIQVTMPFFTEENCAHVRMGLFYEELTAAIFGGSLSHSISLYDDADGIIKPDVINHKRKIAVESKAIRSGHQFNSNDEQTERYKTLQIRKLDYKIYFIFYRHIMKKIMGCKLPINELNKELSTKTQAAICLPFSLILNMHENKRFKRYDDPGWISCTRIGSKFLNEFLFSPIKTIKKLGEDSDNFSIKQCLLPGGIKIEKQTIDPFPIVMIEDKDHEKWKDRYFGEVPF